MSNCHRLNDIDYGAFLLHADKVEKENCTLKRCRSIWHQGLKQLAQSKHAGLQRRAQRLQQKWSRKEYVSAESTFGLYLGRKQGLNAGSLKALAASDIYWNERICHDYRQAEEGLRQQAPGGPSGSSSNHGTKDALQGIQKGKGEQNPLNKEAAGTPDSSAEHQQEPPSSGTRKRKQSGCVTLEPWHTLTKTVHNLVNGRAPVFISPPSDMPTLQRFMFIHAQNLLKEYCEKNEKRKQIDKEKEEKETLLEDSMVVLSGVMNVMSDRFTSYCESSDNMDLHSYKD
ncbi:hypothetical protein EMPS_09941 [Entomortierella parvispora]|uniref:Uncharacterized protein n=1 Tax=Entomortierella parvispora TaxID=205924 RepID=A0A9P3HJT5_9FUNG|nr:hypothetical protein EMPS_09941 [Entomortierella parvispora]